MTHRPDPVAEAKVARLVLQDLDCATRQLDSSDDTYRVLASLTDTTASLLAVIHTLADVHTRNAHHTTDPTGELTSGRQAATAVAADLTRSADALSGARTALDSAWVGAAQLIWPHPTPTDPSGAPQTDPDPV